MRAFFDLAATFAATCSLLLACPSYLLAQPDPPPPESISVRVVGVLHTGVVAIGGETTGTTITARGITWELDFGQKSELERESAGLDGKLVVVEGTLERRQGVEIPQRWIVSVEKIRDAIAREQADRPAADQPGDREPDQPGDQPSDQTADRPAEPAEKPSAEPSGDRPNAPPRLTATTMRADSRVEFLVEESAVVIDVRSERGIDSATIARAGDGWPLPLVVRLHLAGLEGLSIGAGPVTLAASISSTGDPVSRVSLRKGDTETSLDPSSPYWTEVRIVGDDRTIPLENGSFEVRLPAKLLEDNPREINLGWIDFYRN